MADLYYIRSTCRLCSSTDLLQVISLIPTPIGDKYVPYEHRSATKDSIPLDLMLCNACGHLQTGAVINPNVIYTHYLSRPVVVNPVLSSAYQAYAEGILSRFAPKPGDLVVEIGSNEGSFLRFFKNRGITVLGVDPARNLAEAATSAGVETLAEFFTSETALKIRREWGPASVVIANFVYANIDELNGATRGICELLGADGIFMFETNYRVDVFQKYLLETLNHEHLSYFAVRPLRDFFRAHGMDLIDVERVSSKGGSIRCTVQRGGGKWERADRVEQMIALEERIGIFQPEFYTPCASHIESIRREIGEMLAEFKAAGKSIAGYGTSIGATILIYQLGLGNALRFLVDDDPYRQNLVSPGYHIPVVSPLELFEQRPDYVAILAPLYKEKIMKNNQAYTEHGGRFINIWPKIEMY